MRIDPRIVSRTRVACCMPVRNPGAEFERTLRSFATLDVKPFLIVVDDASEPPLSIDFASLGLEGTVVRRPVSEGIAAALNQGLDLACASQFAWIARMDGDDLNLPERFSMQIAHLEAHPECLAVFSQAALIDERDRPIGFARAPISQRALLRAMAVNNVLIHPTACLRRRYVERYGLYDPSVNHAEDYDYFLRGVVDGAVQVIDQPLIRYRVHGASVSHRRYRAQLRARIRVQLRFLRRTGVLGCVGLIRSVGLLIAASVIEPDRLGRWRRALLARKAAAAAA